MRTAVVDMCLLLQHIVIVQCISLSLSLSPDANCIVEFGLNGNGLDRVVTYQGRRDLRVHCRAGTSDADIDWFFANGTKVGSSNQNLREGHYLNGTTVLQIASNRRLSLCDAGTYTCVTNCSGMTQSRNFTLVINCKYWHCAQLYQVISESKNFIVPYWDIAFVG